MVVAAALFPDTLPAQTDGTCVPIAQRGTRTLGCYIVARHELGPLPRDTALYWFIDKYPTLASAQQHQGPRSLAVESLGQTWLYSLGPRETAPPTTAHTAVIGPLPLVAATSFAAVYMEGIFEPGMASVVHRHAGVEAWYTIEGAQCLESPSGRVVQQAGDTGVMIAGGLPMQLTGIGTSIRRSLVLILQDSSQPRSTPAHDWHPTGLCRAP